MKVVYITSARIPSERAYAYAISKLCEEWGKAGHSVRLILPDRKNGQQEDPIQHYKLEKTFTIEKISATDFVGSQLSASRVRFALDMLSFVISLRKMRFDAETFIYTREYLLALVLPKNRLFIEMHTLPNRGFLLRSALRRARGVIAISNGVRDELVALGIPAEKIFVAHDGVDLASFSKVQADRSLWMRFGIVAGSKVVLYTGHFYGWKGADTLAKAGKTLPQNIHTVLIGGVDAELKAFQKDFAAPNVHIVPHQPRDMVPVLLKSADVLVLPNSAKAEISRLHASPLKLFEYMASGVPIVASDVPSLREILSEETAYFFKPDDAADLAVILTKMFGENEKAEIKGTQALSVVKQYTWQERARSIAEFVDKRGAVE